MKTTSPGRKPEWLKIDLTANEGFTEIKQMMRGKKLHTVCEEARCPNIHECWGQHGTATFMILGNTCTRNCRFCAVHSGLPTELDLEEPQNVAHAVRDMGLQHVVITSVARDDLQDEGSLIFAATIREIRRLNSGTAIEVLIPDFNGREELLQNVLDAGPDILNHNVETVERLSDHVRSKAKYRRSLTVLQNAKKLLPGQITKSGMMLGLGEAKEEVVQTLRDLRAAGVDLVTIGQYLQPTRTHLSVVKYYSPEEFREFRAIGLSLGFAHVEAGPLVRSSYHAHEQARQAGFGEKADSLSEVTGS